MRTFHTLTLVMGAIFTASAIRGEESRPRLFFNSDNGTPVLYYHKPPMTAEKMCRVLNDLKDLPVDVFLSCPQFADDSFIYPTKVAEVSDGRHVKPGQNEPEEFRQWRSNVRSMLELHIDPIAVQIHRAHELGMQFWPTLRMNDIHKDWTDRWPSLRTPWELQNVNLVIGKDFPDLYPVRTQQDFTWALDYAHQAVRDRKFAIIDEICTNYEVDGFELDFLRSVFFFLKSQERAGMPLMTDLVRRVRSRMDEIGRQRGKQLHLHVRVPPSIAECEQVGLDLRTWIKERLVDSITAQAPGYLDPVADIRGFVEAAKGTDIGISGGLEYYVRDYGDSIQTNIAMLRAAAAAYWYQGAESLYLFNYDCHGPFPLRGEKRQALIEIADPQTLVHKDKHYFVTKDMDRVLPEDGGDKQLPFVLKRPGTEHRCSWIVGDDLAAAKDADALKSVRLRVKFAKYNAATQQVSCVFNGHTLPDEKIEANAITFVDAPARQGVNELTIALAGRTDNAAASLRIEGIELFIEYGKTTSEPPPADRNAGTPIDVGSHKQLFVDDKFLKLDQSSEGKFQRIQGTTPEDT